MRRWRTIPLSEIAEVLDDLIRRGACHAGSVHAELVRRYGADRIKHKMGHGWYRLTDAAGGAA